MMKTHLFVLPVVRLVRCVKYADWERAKNNNKQTTDLKAIFEVMEFLLIFTHQIKSTFFFTHFRGSWINAIVFIIINFYKK